MRVMHASLSHIGDEASLRFDFNYIKSSMPTNCRTYSFDELFSIVPPDVPALSDLDRNFLYCEIGDCNGDGDIFPVHLNFNDRQPENEDYYRKIEKGDITSVERNEILVSKVRPNLKKMVFVTSDKENVFFTTAFIRIRPKEMPEILYHCLRSVFLENLLSISRQGKGYPTINESDLHSIRFDASLIDRLRAERSNVTDRIIKISEHIRAAQLELLPEHTVINDVFCQEFNLDIDGYERIARTNKVRVLSTCMASGNRNLRFSYRWFKAEEIQKYTLDHLNCASRLGEHIISTQNGWSPSTNEEGAGFQMLGIDAISQNGILCFDNLKHSTVNRADISSYIIKDMDFFVSRGNTVDLVAMASVAHVEKEDMSDTIFPDLMIRMEFDNLIDKQFMAFVFNSLIGRYYFRFCTKGKNQTMVKVSPQELYDFVVPLPSLERQRMISEKIQDKLNKNTAIRKHIAELRKQIDAVVNL